MTRLSVNDITSDQLDALYERIAELENDAAIRAEVDAKTDEHLNDAHEVARYFKALAERAQAWGEQHRDRANRYRARTDAVRTECDAVLAESASSTSVALMGRRVAATRIRAALQTISHDTPVPDDPRVTALDRVMKLAAVWDDAPDPLAQAMARDLRTAINGPKEN
ncbi:hypothetical protein OG292_19185 [Streptomyces sp. NBC_01511]|uniref:hypothetical protein n=1 Tax=Streptomyces sp. NBC_01511 TaxID=2903889 RepID=UPI00386AB565